MTEDKKDATIEDLPDMAPAAEVEEKLGDPVPMVRLTGYIPHKRKSVIVTEDHFEVPIIEPVMFYHDQQFGREQMDVILNVSKNAFAPMVGYICKKSDITKGTEAIKGFFASEEFKAEVDKYSEALTDEALERNVKKMAEDMAADYGKKRNRIHEITFIVGSGNVIQEDITGMTQEELAKRENGNREQRRSVKTKKGHEDG